ncbi:GlcNAc-PI de-N-acetylase [Arthrobacter sp. AG1021]|uniref:PIG-L family deacetylase n=1 Tax=Arthrobacter sp. AG1021 TaxID=2183908 RepID=UPI0006B248C6|nr:PIG-L family deacetylase [Arthrobacter sp. AG1021]ALD64235.1 hypothetical protein AFL94_10210 [Arthrobacter sp. LS16]RKS22651.1 GlcNAc-PI de-N-acetylase [Arthrobacter sp. AG1021]
MSEPHSIAVIVAHPDDDAYGCAGSSALHETNPGFKFILVIATDGGAGLIADAFHQAREVPGPGLRRLLHGEVRESTFQRWNASRERRGLPPFDPAVEYQLRPVPDSLIDIEVDTTQVAGRILAGLHEHAASARC